MPWKKVVDNYSGAVPFTSTRVRLQGLEDISVIITGTLGTCIVIPKAVIDVPGSEEVVSIFYKDRSSQGYIEHQLNGVGFYSLSDLSGASEIEFELTVGSPTGLDVWAWDAGS